MGLPDVTKPRLLARRAALINNIFGASTLPATLPTTVTEDWGGRTKPTGCNRLDRLQITVHRGGLMECDLLHPSARAINRLLVFHAGHWESYTAAGTDSKVTVEYFLARGFHVLCACMPASGINPSPYNITIAGVPTEYTGHNDMGPAVDADGGSSARVFLESALFGLNHSIAELDPEHVYMCGISGGGWSTTMLAAMDTRIEWSCDVFGSVPLSMRPPGDGGDYEQTITPPWMSVLSPGDSGRSGFERLYELGAFEGRRRMQILGSNEAVFPIATVLSQVDAYMLENRRTLRHAYGTISFLNDTVATAHAYNDTIRAAMLADIAEMHPF